MGVYSRQATSFDDQINLLEDRGLKIEDKNFANEALKQIGYFRFKGYCLPYYLEKDRFRETITFEDIYNNYRFDERFRLLLFQIIEHIEVELKSIIGNQFALEFEPLGHYKDSNFKEKSYHVKWLEEFETNIGQASRRRELYTEHYINKYENTFPIWVALEMTSFGSLSKFYNNLPNYLQNKVSKNTYKVHKDFLANWMYCVTIMRNICAHTSRIYDKILPIKIKVPEREKGKFTNERAFAVVFVCKKLCLDEGYYKKFTNNLTYLLKQYKNYIDLDKIGFPENWEEIIEKA